MEGIKNFKLNYKIDTYKKFIDYFDNLYVEEKDYIIENCYNYLMCEKKISHKSLEKISNMYDILKHKIKYDKLNNKERKIYEYIQAYLIYTDRYEKTEHFDIYVNKYLTNISLDNIGKKVFLVIQNIINSLNNEFKLDTYIYIDEAEENTLGSVEWEDIESIIYLNKLFFKDLYNNKLIIDDLIGYISYIIFIILHEYGHIIQKNYMFRNNDKKSLDYEMDFYLIQYSKLYKKLHNYFIVEKEANDFAIDRLINELKKYFQNKVIDEKEILRDINDAFTHYNDNIAKKFLVDYKLRLLLLKSRMKLNIESKDTKELKKVIDEIKTVFQNTK